MNIPKDLSVSDMMSLVDFIQTHFQSGVFGTDYNSVVIFTSQDGDSVCSTVYKEHAEVIRKILGEY